MSNFVDLGLGDLSCCLGFGEPDGDRDPLIRENLLRELDELLEDDRDFE
jgi:hypothetical protein